MGLRCLSAGKEIRRENPAAKRGTSVCVDRKAAKKFWQHYPSKRTEKQTGHTL